MEKLKLEKWQKIGIAVCGVGILCSILLFVPFVQNLALDFGENVLVHRPLTRAVWIERFFSWGMNFPFYFGFTIFLFAFWKKLFELYKVLNTKKIVFSIFVFCLSFILLSLFWNKDFFTTDEGDIFFIGKSMAKGQILYKERFAHHMPVPYFISLVFYFFGAKTFILQRLCFYFLIAFLWGCVYYRYSDLFGKKTLFLYPVFYVLLISNVNNGWSILGEQFQGIGMVVLLMELLLFQSARNLEMQNFVSISIAIFISFGSIFVSVFPIFFIFLTFLLGEVLRIFNNSDNIGSSILGFGKQCCILLFFILIPFFILLIYFIGTKSVNDFFLCAYKMNTTVYSKYLGGYGNNILYSMFIGIRNILLIFFSLMKLKVLPVFLILIIGALYFFIELKKIYRNPVLTIGCFLFLQSCATRGCFSFHGLPFIALLCFMTAYSFEHVILFKFSNKSLFKYFFMGVYFLISIPYIKTLPNLKDLTIKEKKQDVVIVIDLLTDENEYFGNSTFDWWLDFQTHALDAPVVGACCPWFWEWGGKKAMEWLYENRPRVYYYDINCATWGYKITDYAPELKQFLDENYSSMDSLGYPCVYVRNDYFEDAKSVIKNCN